MVKSNLMLPLSDVRTAYPILMDFLAGRQTRKVAHNTWVSRQLSGNIAIRFHNTDIVVYTPTGVVGYYTGGWDTVTTLQRMNQFSPYSLFKDDGDIVIDTGVDEMFYRPYILIGADGLTAKRGAASLVELSARPHARSVAAGPWRLGPAWPCLSLSQSLLPNDRR